MREFDFSKTRVLVAGDVMLDVAMHGTATRLSPEAPVPVLNGLFRREDLGGAGNAAANCAGLGASVTLLGIWGGSGIEEHAARHGISVERVHAPSTLVKTRYFADGQQLLRVDDDADFSTHSASLSLRLSKIVHAHDVLLLSDYAKGSLHTIVWMIEAARRAGVPVVVDPKGRDFTRYAGATLLKPNRAEFESAAGPVRDRAHFEKLGMDLRFGLDLDALLVTEGGDGMTLFARRSAPLRIPARPAPVPDVTGAGDTVAAVMACAIAAGIDYAEAARLASRAAAVAVSRPGTVPITQHDLRGEAASGRIVDASQAETLVMSARQSGCSIVVANGCFDVLHAGHVAMLRHARRQGDRLLVAVNDDASVALIKGRGRPVNPLALRMEVIAALDGVDWVVPFSGDTPKALLAALRPDVLIKGADWQGRDVAGAEHCGRVEFAPLRAGLSTTATVEALRRAA